MIFYNSGKKGFKFNSCHSHKCNLMMTYIKRFEINLLTDFNQSAHKMKFVSVVSNCDMFVRKNLATLSFTHFNPATATHTY